MTQRFTEQPGKRDAYSAGRQNAGPVRSGEAAELSPLLGKIDFGEALPADLFSDTAEKAAGLVHERGGRDRNKRTQLRRFYDELSMWNERVQLGQGGRTGGEDREKSYKELEPFIKMLKAKAAYAKGRRHVDETFNSLFADCIGKIKDATSLKHCKLFWEAFMGYYRVLDK
jgi:CRISPR-associated protein Csm2